MAMKIYSHLNSEYKTPGTLKVIHDLQEERDYYRNHYEQGLTEYQKKASRKSVELILRTNRVESRTKRLGDE